MGFLPESDCDRILRLLDKLGFSLWSTDLLHTDTDGKLVIIGGLEEFREHLGGRLTITLLKAIGEGFEVNEMNIPNVANAVYELRDRSSVSTNPKIIPANG